VLTVQQSYNKARDKANGLHLKLILDFGTDFGFLFMDNNKSIMLGMSYILIDKQDGSVSLLPTTPDNINRIQSAKRIPLPILKLK
jgi:hypothetical protein